MQTRPLLNTIEKFTALLWLLVNTKTYFCSPTSLGVNATSNNGMQCGFVFAKLIDIRRRNGDDSLGKKMSNI